MPREIPYNHIMPDAEYNWEEDHSIEFGLDEPYVYPPELWLYPRPDFSRYFEDAKVQFETIQTSTFEERCTVHSMKDMAALLFNRIGQAIRFCEFLNARGYPCNMEDSSAFGYGLTDFLDREVQKILVASAKDQSTPDKVIPDRTFTVHAVADPGHRPNGCLPDSTAPPDAVTIFVRDHAFQQLTHREASHLYVLTMYYICMLTRPDGRMPLRFKPRLEDHQEAEPETDAGVKDGEEGANEGASEADTSFWDASEGGVNVEDASDGSVDSLTI